MTARQRRLDRMRAIMRQYRVATIAARDLQGRFRADPSWLSAEKLRPADFQGFRNDLESTYLIRLFAEFETGLREAWARAFGQVTSPRTRDLIDAFAARRFVPAPWHDMVHDVRAYRNALVHEAGADVPPIGMDAALGYLCRFFSHLPHDW